MSARSMLLRERFTRQGLAGRPQVSIAAAAARTTAIQAQDGPAARLGLRARAFGLREADVLAALDTERSVARTWLMRGTIHLVDTADLRWLVRLIGPSIARKMHTRWRQIGLTDDVLDRGIDALPEILADGALDRHAITAALAERGIRPNGPDPQAHTHAIVHASSTGLICRGPDRGRHSTFALTSEWVPGAPAGPSGDAALAELARRYFTSFSPATAADFTTWSGLASTPAIEAIRDELTPVDVDGRPGFRLGEIELQRGLRLLPAFDNYVLGYHDREALLTADRQPSVYHGGVIRPTLVIDGVVAGTWKLARTTRASTVIVSPFSRLTKRDAAALDGEVADLARFLDRDVEAEVARPD